MGRSADLYDWYGEPEPALDPEEAASVGRQLALAAESDRLRHARHQLRYPREWAEYVRLRPLLDYDFGLGDFTFEAFLLEVMRRPGPGWEVVRRDETLPFCRGNLHWVSRPPVRTAVPPPPSPYLTSKQAAAYLNVSYSFFRKVAVRIPRASQTGKYRREELDAYASAAKQPKRKR